jgi:carboxyl-terminal processing protease
VQVDNKPLKKGLVTDDVFKLLKGPPGRWWRWTSSARTRPRAPLLDRAREDPDRVGALLVHDQPGVGYVRIIRFAQTTGDELEKAIGNLQGAGHEEPAHRPARELGRPAEPGVDVLDQLVPEDSKLVYTRGRIQSSNADYYSTDRKGKWTDGALVVLVDHGSASASEIVRARSRTSTAGSWPASTRSARAWCRTR